MAPDSGGREHGGLDPGELRRLGIAPTEVLDFSVNVNPYGPTAAMRAAIAGAAIDRYPDPTASRARGALARVWNVDPESIVLGAGAAELLWLVVRAVVRSGESIAVAGPTFSEVPAAAAAAGAVTHELTAQASDSFRHDPAGLIHAVNERGARLVYLCTPNNPTGVAWPIAEVAAVVASCPAALFIVDQSFLSLSDRHEDAAVGLPDNAVRVRSLTKDHAIPGVRAGAVIASATFARTLEGLRPAWSTGAATQAATIAAAAEQDFVADSRRRLLADQSALAEGLRALGLPSVPTSTVFTLVHVGRAAELRSALLRRSGILVRDCTSFGLPEHLRIAARPPDDRARLLAALRACR